MCVCVRARGRTCLGSLDLQLRRRPGADGSSPRPRSPRLFPRYVTFFGDHGVVAAVVTAAVVVAVAAAVITLAVTTVPISLASASTFPNSVGENPALFMWVLCLFYACFSLIAPFAPRCPTAAVTGSTCR